jgi:hypothetical protein
MWRHVMASVAHSPMDCACAQKLLENARNALKQLLENSYNALKTVGKSSQCARAPSYRKVQCDDPQRTQI